MKNLSESELRKLLRQSPSNQAPNVPEDLLARIQAEIPEHLQVPALEPDAAQPTTGRTWTQLRLIAATLIGLLGAGWLYLQLGQDMADQPKTDAAEKFLEVQAVPVQDSAAPESPQVETPNSVSQQETNLQEALKRAESPADAAAAEQVIRETEPVPTATPTADPEVSDSRRANRQLRAPTPDEAQQLATAKRERPPKIVKEDLPKPKAKSVPALGTTARRLPPPPPPPPPPASPARLSTPAHESKAEVRRLRRWKLGSSRPVDVPAPELAGHADDEFIVAETTESTASIRKQLPGARELEEELAPLQEETARDRRDMEAPSTGGTREPNDAPYGDTFFEGYGTNPFIDTEDDAQSTFGLDVDTGSYTVVRSYLEDGHLPPKDAVRIEELLNYFDYGDAPPAEGDFALRAEGAPSIFASGERYYLLRVAIQGREIAVENRAPADLIFVIDTSGSMAKENRLGLVQDALLTLLGQLRDDDRVALVTYGSTAQVHLDLTGDLDAVRRAVLRLQADGSTYAEAGLVTAYELAARQRRQGAISRLLLCSDGVANVGRTGPESILERVKGWADEGIELTTVGFGMSNYNDVLMEQLADRGNGRYAYVDSLAEAERLFVEQLTGTLQTVAAEARAQIEFDPETVSRYRLLGYENRDIADERFRDDSVDAGEIGAGHTITALWEIKLKRALEPSERIATARLRWASVAEREMVEIERRISAADIAPSWDQASPALRLASLVAEYGELLKRTYWARDGSPGRVAKLAEALTRQTGDPRAAELARLSRRVQALWPKPQQ